MDFQKQIKIRLSQSPFVASYSPLVSDSEHFHSSLTDTNAFAYYLWNIRQCLFRVQTDLAISTRADPNYLEKLNVLQNESDKNAPLPGDFAPWHPKAVPRNLKVITMPMFLKTLDEIKTLVLTKKALKEGICIVTQSLTGTCTKPNVKSRDWIASIMMKDEMTNTNVVYADIASPAITPVLLLMAERGMRRFVFVDDGLFSGGQMLDDLKVVTGILSKSKVPKRYFTISIFAVGCSEDAKIIINDYASRSGFTVKLRHFFEIKRMGGSKTLHDTIFEHKIPDEISIPRSISLYLKKHIDDTPYKKPPTSTCDATRPAVFLDGQTYDEMMSELSDVFDVFKKGNQNKRAKNVMAGHITGWLKKININLEGYKRYEQTSKEDFVNRHNYILINQLYHEEEEFERLKQFNLVWIQDLEKNPGDINLFRIALIEFKENMQLRRNEYEKTLKTAEWRSNQTKYEIVQFEKHKPDYYVDEQSILSFVEKFMSLCGSVSSCGLV